MDNQVFGVILGVKIETLPSGYDDGGDGLNFADDADEAVTLSGHKSTLFEVCYDDDPEQLGIFGFWIAIGKDGNRGALPLKTPIELDKMRDDDRYKLSIAAAERSFAIVSEWAHSKGIDLGVPKLWLAMTDLVD
jgi:hypothetical protein